MTKKSSILISINGSDKPEMIERENICRPEEQFDALMDIIKKEKPASFLNNPFKKSYPGEFYKSTVNVVYYKDDGMYACRITPKGDISSTRKVA